MRKKIYRLSLVFVCALSLIACKKGDEGPAGATGPAGPAGPQGVPGNANIILYNFGPQTFTGATSYVLSNLSRGRVDSSLVLVYYNPSTEAETAWYPCPGGGSGGAYETRFFIYQSSIAPSRYTLGLRAITPAGASYPNPLTFNKLRVIIALTSSILPGGRSSQPAVDYTDYYAVKKYFNLPD